MNLWKLALAGMSCALLITYLVLEIRSAKRRRRSARTLLQTLAEHQHWQRAARRWKANQLNTLPPFEGAPSEGFISGPKTSKAAGKGARAPLKANAPTVFLESQLSHIDPP